MLFQFDVLTDIGNSRTIQQDNVLTIPQLLHDNLTATDNQFYDDANGALFVVADGMGGGPHGEYASFMVVEGIQEYVVKNKILLNSDIYSLINGAIQYANQRILNHLKSHPEDKSMGSTVVIGLLHQDVIHIGWVGDSRCYHVVDHRLFQLTHDHSLVQSLVDEGSITEEEAFDHPRRNIIQQSLGMHEVIPSYERYSVQAEQKLIFCSDGLNSMVRDHEILSICDSDIPITEVVTNLVAAANEAGGHDNISCIGVNLFSSPRKQKSNYKPEDSAATKISTKKRIPIILLLICTVLILSFVFVVRFLSKSNIGEAKIANKSTVAPKDENPDNSFSQEIPAVPNSEHSTSIDGTYFIRVKVFSDSIPAVHFLKEVQLTIPQLSFYLNHPTNGLFEIVTENFPDKKSANRHLGLINYPEAVVIFKNNVE